MRLPSANAVCDCTTCVAEYGAPVTSSPGPMPAMASPLPPNGPKPPGPGGGPCASKACASNATEAVPRKANTVFFIVLSLELKTFVRIRRNPHRPRIAVFAHQQIRRHLSGPRRVHIHAEAHQGRRIQLRSHYPQHLAKRERRSIRHRDETSLASQTVRHSAQVFRWGAIWPSGHLPPCTLSPISRLYPMHFIPSPLPSGAFLAGSPASPGLCAALSEPCPRGNP